MKTIHILIFMLFFKAAFSQTNLQQSLSLKGDGSAAHASALLEVQATDKGMLIPRLTSAQRQAIASPAAGLLVFDTTTNGFWFFNGTAWQSLAVAGYTAGTGIGIAGNIISNTGDTNPADDLTNASIADADLDGTFSNLQIETTAVGTAEIANGSVTAAKFSSGAASSGQVLTANGAGAATWTDLPGSIFNKIQDADADTKIQVEKSPDEDIIRFDLGGTENMALRKNAAGDAQLELVATSGNTLIGKNAGNALASGVRNVATGSLALASNTTGNRNTAFGDSTLFSNTSGNDNTGVGRKALFSNAGTGGKQNTAIGRDALFDNTSGEMNTAHGFRALWRNTTGNFNAAIGVSALRLNTTGLLNTATGMNALFFNSTGSSNTSSGGNALFSNSTGARNTACGYEALYANTTGSDNVAVGMKALFSNIDGYSNTAIGINALRANTSGNLNTAHGYSTLIANSIGDLNTAFGSLSLTSNTTGGRNTAVGYSTLYLNTTGASNTAIGSSAMYSNTTGSNNTGNGRLALYHNTTGNGNTAVGAYTLEDNTTGNNNTATGRSALVLSTTSSNNTALGRDALRNNTTGFGGTAVGTGAIYANTTGNTHTAIGASALASNTTGNANTAVGNNALFLSTTGSDNTAAGVNANYYNVTGSGTTLAGYAATLSFNDRTNSTVIGYDALLASSNFIRFGNSSVTSIGGQVEWSSSSDGRFKRNVQENVAGLDFITRLRPVTYQWDIHAMNEFMRPGGDTLEWEGKYDIEKMRFTGFIAQEVEQAAKEVGYDFSGVGKPQDERTPYSLCYAEFTVPLVKAVQELAEKAARRQEMLERNQADIEKLEWLETHFGAGSTAR
ncbi:MAG: tail fiber domain-containing protein [Bacteroidota bacterium]